MKYFFSGCIIALVAMIATPVHADSNANDTTVVVNSEEIALTGVFDHAGAAGDADNSVTSLTFTGGFLANQIRVSGDLQEIAGATFGSEADIIFTSPPPLGALTGISHTWQNPLGGTFTGPLSYDAASDLLPDFAGGIDPNGTWDIEFIDTFDDAAGADSQSSNVVVTFEEVTGGIEDFDGDFSLGSLAGGGTVTNNGEFAVGGVFDLYEITLTEDGLLDIFTEADPDGFVGANADTEIAIFAADGTLVATNDDGGPGGGLFSGLTEIDLAAGTYEIAVASFNSAFADGFDVTPGAGTGDYALSVSLAATAVPEPTSLGILGLVVGGILLRRRRS